jgi:hypothetical protein
MSALFPRDHQPLPLGPESRRSLDSPASLLAMDVRPASPHPRWSHIYTVAQSPLPSPESRRGCRI